ncbi:MAG: DUF1272 domain-containing protein [Actinomycetota bacterium]
MLLMKPNCECCDRDLDPSSAGPLICSFECTWCADCAANQGGTCPNCGGTLVARPTRDAGLLEAFPAATERAAARRQCPV